MYKFHETISVLLPLPLQLWKFRYFSAGLLMTPDHYPEHVKKVEELIASGEAGKKVAKEIAEDRKVGG